MNLTKNTILAFGLLVAGASFAQTAPTALTETTPVGLLGQSYTEARFGLSDIKYFSKHQYGAGIAGNVPVSPFLDVGASYDYGWINDLGHFNSVAANATAYTTFNGIKPFITGGVGHQWISASGFRDREWGWGAGGGVEIPLGALTLTPRIIYTDDFEDNSDGQTSYEVEANYWLTRTLAIFGSVGRSDVRGTNMDSWDYTVGARFKF